MNVSNSSGSNSSVPNWSTADAILERIQDPVFPARDFVITDYGAVAGGETLCTEMIAAAIADCHNAGGGRVVVPAGVFLTGKVHLKSNVNLHLVEGATLLFSTNPQDYLPLEQVRWEGVECFNFSPLIFAAGQENIAVTGQGTLDGGATWENWWAWKDPSRADADRQNEMADRNVPVAERIFGEGHLLRPNFFQPTRCRNVMIEGVTIVRSPMWEVNPVLCTNVTVRGVKINCHGPNNDGCDPDSCQDVLIEDCVFDCGDDCIAIKSGRNDDGRRIGVPIENVIIRNCLMKDGHGGVSIGSEISGGCRNVFIENCHMDSPNLSRAIRFKSNAKRGGTIENTLMRNVTIGQVGEAVVTIDLLYEEGANGKHHPVIRNFVMEHVTANSAPRVFFVQGYEAAVIDGIQLTDCAFTGLTASEVLGHVGRVTMERVSMQPAQKVLSLHSRSETVW